MARISICCTYYKYVALKIKFLIECNVQRKSIPVYIYIYYDAWGKIVKGTVALLVSVSPEWSSSLVGNLHTIP